MCFGLFYVTISAALITIDKHHIKNQVPLQQGRIQRHIPYRTVLTKVDCDSDLELSKAIPKSPSWARNWVLLASTSEEIDHVITGLHYVFAEHMFEIQNKLFCPGKHQIAHFL